MVDGLLRANEGFTLGASTAEIAVAAYTYGKALSWGFHLGAVGKVPGDNAVGRMRLPLTSSTTRRAPGTNHAEVSEWEEGGGGSRPGAVLVGVVLFLVFILSVMMRSGVGI